MNEFTRTFKQLTEEREALRHRLGLLDAALAAVASLGGYEEAESKSKAVSKAASPSPVIQRKKLRRFTNTRWRQKLQPGQGDYITQKRRKLHRHTCLQCGRGFLGVKTARFHGKKCADNYYTKHYRQKDRRVGKATHPNASRITQDAPGSTIGDYVVTDTGFKHKSAAKPLKGLKRHYTSTQEERRLIAQRAGLAAAQNRRAREKARLKAEKHGVTLIPGDGVTAEKEI